MNSSSTSWELLSTSEKHTRTLAAQFVDKVKPGDTIALQGDVGAGKTVFTQGFVHALGIPNNVIVCSPSYTIVTEYAATIPVYHIDLYRLGEGEEVMDFLDDYFTTDHITIIEWAEKLPINQPITWRICFEHLGERIRKLVFNAYSAP